MAMITAMTMTSTDRAPSPVYASGLRVTRLLNSAMCLILPEHLVNRIAEPSHRWRQPTQEFLSELHGISWYFLPDSLETAPG
jgi:hypothetical protein